MHFKEYCLKEGKSVAYLAKKWGMCPVMLRSFYHSRKGPSLYHALKIYYYTKGDVSLLDLVKDKKFLLEFSEDYFRFNFVDQKVVDEIESHREVVMKRFEK